MLLVNLSKWAFSFDSAPASIVNKERLRHLFVASICGSEMSFERRLSSLVRQSRLPQQLGGIVGPLSVLMSWEEKKQLDRTLLCTLCGAEIASRLGTALLLADPFRRQSIVSISCAVITLAKLQNCSASHIANALAIALASPPQLSARSLQRSLFSFYLAVHSIAQMAVQAAKNGVKGDLGILDDEIFATSARKSYSQFAAHI